jgi:uncharacterized membrane protein HdeD (DUF308 family)
LPQPPSAPFVWVGGVFVMLGLTASIHLYRATFPVLWIMEVALCAAGFLLLVLALCEESYKRGFPLLLIGVLYLGWSAALMLKPAAAIETLALAAAILMILTGILRILVPLPQAPPGGATLGASGFIAILVGIAILLGWPGKAAWAISLVLALDLLVLGAGLVAFGIGRRRVNAGRAAIGASRPA